jgi:hypothetical protein
MPRGFEVAVIGVPDKIKGNVSSNVTGLEDPGSIEHIREIISTDTNAKNINH